MDAAAIVGMLADDERRRCWAALELGATTSDAVVAATGLSIAQVARALGRLVTSGLVVSGIEGGLHVTDGVFRTAAREALDRPPSGEHDGMPDEIRKVLSSFVVDGRISQIPTSSGKRRIVLDWLAQQFEPGQRYTEPMVNLILGQRHADTAALRRYMVDAGILDREAGEYWRSGGTVIDPSA
jgi:hypothetical protein